MLVYIYIYRERERETEREREKMFCIAFRSSAYKSEPCAAGPRPLPQLQDPHQNTQTLTTIWGRAGGPLGPWVK